MKNQKKAEAVAAERMQLLAPLLAEGLDNAKAKQIKESICRQTGLSERTLRRYLEKYRKEGFGGLKPQGKARNTADEAIPIHILEQAIFCLLYTSDAADDLLCVDLGGRRIIKKKK